MAASITHLVVGETVWKQVYSDLPAEVQGAFLAGCMLVDVHAFNNIDRRRTHFAGQLEEEGENAFRQSCSSFLSEVDALLRRPWNSLTPSEKFFVAGYLCHLAADECWRKLGWELFKKLGIATWVNSPVPGDVILTTFDFISRGQWIDPPELDSVLENISIPDVFTHIPIEIFRKQWVICRDYVAGGGTPDAHFKMLERAGRSSAEIEAARRRYEKYWEKGIMFVNEIGGVEPFIQDAVERTMQVLPRLMRFSLDK